MTCETPPQAEPSAIDAFRASLSDVVVKMPSPMAIFDREMRYVLVSDSWRQQFRLADIALIGRCHYDVSPWLSEEHRAAHRRGLEGETVAVSASRTVLPDGTETWDSWQITPLRDPDGSVAGIALLVVNLTAQKQAQARMNDSERRLQQVLAHSGIGLFEHDYETGRSFRSATLQAMLGPRTRLERFEDWLALIDPDDRPALSEARRRALDPSGDGLLAADFRPMIDGHIRTFEVLGHVEFTGIGATRRPRRITGILIDRSTRASMSEALAHAQRLETVGRMAGIIAHDFNNLLTVILSNLEFAQGGQMGHLPRDHLDRAMEATRIAAGFSHRLLGLAGARVPHVVSFDVDAHLAEVWNVMSRVLGERLHIRFQPGADGGFVRLDRSELDGALLNLLINARDACPDGGEIVLSTRLRDIGLAEEAAFPNVLPGRYLQICVQDTGHGMSPETLNRATDAFFTTKPTDQGSGLGLTSVDKAMSRAGGFLSIRSTPGTGSQVSLFLPLLAGPFPVPNAAETPGSMPMGDGETVLVVEDDPLVREATLDRIEALGYATLEAGTVAQAIDLLRNCAPVDIVFSDVVLPDKLSGYDLTNHVRRAYPDMAVLLTSGHASMREPPEGQSHAEVTLLQKPYPMEALAEALSQALRRVRTPA